MAMVDEETRVMILKKTWCHGQLILPALAVWYLWMAITIGSDSFSGNHRIDRAVLAYAGLVLPCWSYFSYHTILATASSANNSNDRAESSSLTSFMDANNNNPLLLYIGGVLVQSAHAGVLWRAWNASLSNSSTINMILMIISGLLLIETAAFLLVMHMFGRTRTTVSTRRNENESYQYQDW
jgi:hypothetical protein